MSGRRMSLHGLDALRSVNADLLGVVVNDMSVRKRGYGYYGYRYQYRGYRYGDVYGQSETSANEGDTGNGNDPTDGGTAGSRRKQLAFWKSGGTDDA